jgi:hypothetical protein
MCFKQPKEQLRQNAKGNQYPERIGGFSAAFACARLWLLFEAPKKERVGKQEDAATDNQEGPQRGASRDHE